MMCLVFIFDVSNDLSLYIAKKKLLIFKVNHMSLSDFEPF